MRVVRGALLVVVGGVVAFFAVSAVVARVADGPVGVLAGGPFTSGERVDAPRDWGFLTDVGEVELQLLDPARSRTTWVVVEEGRAYIPCGFLDVPLWKQWPHEALQDGRALLRVESRLYPVLVERVEDTELHARLGRLAAAKYGFGGDAPPDPDQVWFFALEPRAAL